MQSNDRYLRLLFPCGSGNASQSDAIVEHINLFPACAEGNIGLSGLHRLVDGLAGAQVEHPILRKRGVGSADSDETMERIDGKFVNASGLHLPHLPTCF